MSILRKISVFTMLLFISMLFLAPVNAKAATVGQQLTSPEDGWQRIDDNDNNILYNGKGWSQQNRSPFYGGGRHISSHTSLNDTVNFRFKGTKLRLISNNYPTYSNDLYIIIDGVKESFSEVATSLGYQILVYENSKLANIDHVVEIGKVSSGTYSTDFNLDAIDIDDTGFLIPFKQPLNLVSTSGDAKNYLSWDAVDGADGYNIKRSITSGGPYETIATGSAITFSDSDVTPGTTYYYVVSAVVSGTESPDSNEASATVEVIPVDNILKVVLEVNEQLQLSLDDDLDVNTEMIWTSSDNAVAAVDGNGVVTALTPGNTVITVTSADGTHTDYINVLVVDDAKDLRLAVDLKVGKFCRLTVDDLTNTVNVTWDSMDPSVAIVASNGKVTAVGKGLVLVTATDDTGEIIGQVYVRVRE